MWFKGYVDFEPGDLINYDGTLSVCRVAPKDIERCREQARKSKYKYCNVEKCRRIMVTIKSISDVEPKSTKGKKHGTSE